MFHFNHLNSKIFRVQGGYPWQAKCERLFTADYVHGICEKNLRSEFVLQIPACPVLHLGVQELQGRVTGAKFHGVMCWQCSCIATWAQAECERAVRGENSLYRHEGKTACRVREGFGGGGSCKRCGFVEGSWWIQYGLRSFNARFEMWGLVCKKF